MPSLSDQLSEVIADADNDALSDMVICALEAQQEMIDDSDGDPRIRLDAIAGCPDMDGIGLVLEMDHLCDDLIEPAREWFRQAWEQEVRAVLSLGDSIRVGGVR